MLLCAGSGICSWQGISWYLQNMAISLFLKLSSHFLMCEFQMLKNGRLKVYNTSHGAFSRQMRTPCVIFCGHPSLRLGDAIHFLEMWGRDARNAIIMTGVLLGEVLIVVVLEIHIPLLSCVAREVSQEEIFFKIKFCSFSYLFPQIPTTLWETYTARIAT